MLLLEFGNEMVGRGSSSNCIAAACFIISANSGAIPNIFNPDMAESRSEFPVEVIFNSFGFTTSSMMRSSSICFKRKNLLSGRREEGKRERGKEGKRERRKEDKEERKSDEVHHPFSV